MASSAEAAAMRRALALAALGLGTTSPNPPVGCVILRPDGQIAGEGWHVRKGEAHAEAQALARAGEQAVGATAVVTLEPCNHYGRTPPCREALITAGIRRVVIALIDPTSRGEGGAAMLTAAGVDVEVGVVADEARVLLCPWLTALETRRPVITWPYVLDDHGLTPLPPESAETCRLRLNADAVLRTDGSVSEAVPGAHGAGVLTLKDIPPGTDPRDAVGALYSGGVRNLLLDGALTLAEPFLRHGLIDHVLAHVPATMSGSSAKSTPWPQLPPGFTITSTRKVDGFAQVQARRAARSTDETPELARRSIG
jgi:diaminohydroxyphosphoribosylaminopyrimidine deaminase/5-amino-6-(5-phosphoribosylamino)uracil reductase